MNNDELVSLIDKYLAGALTLDEIEDYTLGLISDDSFDIESDEFQCLVYDLDNAKLNEFDKEDVKIIRDKIAALK